LQENFAMTKNACSYIPAYSDASTAPRTQTRMRPIVLALFMMLGVVGGVTYQRAERQRQAVRNIELLGGSACYDYQIEGDGIRSNATSWIPPIILEKTGVDLFHSVVEVSLLQPQLPKERSIEAENQRIRALDVLYGLPSVQVLRVSGRLVNDKRMCEFGKMRSLRELVITNASQVTNRGIESLSTSNSLETVQLTRAGLDDEALRWFSYMPNLRCLVLYATKFSNQGLAYLNKSQSLEQLWLDSSPSYIDDSGLAFLQTMPKLKDVSLPHASLTAEAKNRLMEANPLLRFAPDWLRNSELFESGDQVDCELPAEIPLQKQ
jgi:hypothetical protein